MELLDQKAVFTGTQVAYFVICPTKLWLFSHFATMEQDSDLVALGKLLQEITFPEAKKDLIIDQKISIDFIRKGDKLILNEIKKSSKLEKAHIAQLLYYIYYLKHIKGIENVEGRIIYPKQRKTIVVNLDEEKENWIKEILKKISFLISLPKPPEPEKKKYCRKCSYFEFCWVKK